MDIYNYLLILIVIIILFFFINYLFKKNIENYGIYCGRYNLQPSIAQSTCSEDSNCAWTPYTSQNGKKYGWCDNAPSNYKPPGSLILNLYKDAEKIIDKTIKTDEEIWKSIM
jgi:hypothetical protein